MEELREKLYSFIEIYGALDPRTVRLSQKLDMHIVDDMKVSRLGIQGIMEKPVKQSRHKKSKKNPLNY